VPVFLLTTAAVAIGQDFPTLVSLARKRSLDTSNMQAGQSQGALESGAVISGTRGVVLAQAVVNLRQLAQGEAAARSLRRKRVVPRGRLQTPVNSSMPVASGSEADNQITGSNATPSDIVIPSSPAPVSTITSIALDSLPRHAAAAVGADRIFLMTDNQTEVLDKQGGLINNIPTERFWESLGTVEVVQARAFYDHSFDRYVAAILGDTQTANASVLFGISETSDPAGNWRLARVKFDPQGVLSPDWLNLGHFNGRIVATANAFNIAAPGNFSRAEIFVVDEHNLYAGNTSATVLHDTTGAGSLAPALNFDPGVTTGYVVCNFNGNSNGRGFMRIGAITGAVGSEQYAPALFFPSVASTWASTSPGNTAFAPQLGSTNKIYVGDDRAQKAIFIGDSIYWANTGFVPASGPTRSVVQLFQVSPGNGTVQQFIRVEDSSGNNFFAFAGTEVNENRDVAITYNRFSATQFPSFDYSYRAGTDPPNTVRGGRAITVSLSAWVVPNPFTWGWHPTALDANRLGMWLFGEYVDISEYVDVRFATVGAFVSPPPTIKLAGDNGTVGQSFQQAGGAGISFFNRPEGARVTLTGMEARNPGAPQGTSFSFLSGTSVKGSRNTLRSLLTKTPQTWSGINAFGDYSIYPIDIADNQDIVIGTEGSHFIGDSGPPNLNVPGYYSSPGLDTFLPKTTFNDFSNWMFRPRLEVTSACKVELLTSGRAFSSGGTFSPELNAHVEETQVSIVSCNAPVVATESWITISSITHIGSSQRVHYKVDPNFTSSPRTGAIKIGDQVYRISQAGNTPLSPVRCTPDSIPEGGQPVQVIVDAIPVMLDGSGTAVAQATGFSLRSIVAWNGSSRPTTLVSATRLKAEISAADIAAAGTARVSVFDVSPTGGTSLSVNFTIASNPLAAVVSAASYLPGLAPESIAAAFGTSLALTTQVAGTNPLPTSLAGTSLRVKDRVGVERLAPLLFVSPGQINFLIPAGTAIGDALLTCTNGNGTVSTRLIQIAVVAPGLFSANASGEGIAAAQALRVKADGSQSYEPVAQFDQAQNKFVSKPIDLGPATDQVFLVAYGTGIRLRSSLSAVTSTIGGAASVVSYAGPQGEFVGLDQLNVLIPRSLVGRGDVDFIVVADGKVANTVRVNIK
jgi:uncharacterized protein (TIGR03437 family)